MKRLVDEFAHTFMYIFAMLALVAAVGCTQGAVSSNLGSDGGVAADAQLPQTCQRDSDCGDGVCLNGLCCGNQQLCGNMCCGAGQLCFANSCVSPGKTCFSGDDCGADQYCEPSLSDQSANKVDTGHACVAPLPKAGRCLPQPPACAAGQDPGDGSCLPACEVRPETKNLDAVARWRWNATNALKHPSFVDVWSTPVVARVTDSNCDGKVNRLDPPNIIFVSGNAEGTCCSCGVKEEDKSKIPSTCSTGVLRVLDGASGKEVFSVRAAEPGSRGFMGLSIAAADIDRDGDVEIIAVTGEGYLVALDRFGRLELKSDQKVPGSESYAFGWGGALAVADMDGDGKAEIAYGTTVFTTTPNGLKLVFTGQGSSSTLAFFSDINGDSRDELITCRAAFDARGKKLWENKTVDDGCHGAAGDFNGDGKAEIVFVGKGKLWVVNGATGKTMAGPLTLPGTGSGGPPTVADFDGDGRAEVGVAMANFYSVIRVDLDKSPKLSLLWKQVNHDMSSSVTGSTVFDFEGDGRAESRLQRRVLFVGLRRQNRRRKVCHAHHFLYRKRSFASRRRRW
jgi:hypothetical protein